MAESLVGFVKNLVFPLLKIESVSPKIPHGHENDKFLRVLRADKSYWSFLLFCWCSYSLLWIVALSIHVVLIVLTAPYLIWLAILITLIVLTKIIVLFVVTRIDYELRWYIITDTSITVRQGAWTIREITVSYQNIQNVSVSQGPLERYFGFANLQIDTAGSSGAKAHGKGMNPNRAVLRGIVNAPQIRDIILDNLRSFRNSGLGDLDDHNPKESVIMNENRLALLQEIAAEAQGLQRAVNSSESPDGL